MLYVALSLPSNFEQPKEVVKGGFSLTDLQTSDMSLLGRRKIHFLTHASGKHFHVAMVINVANINLLLWRLMWQTLTCNHDGN